MNNDNNSLWEKINREIQPENAEKIWEEVTQTKQNILEEALNKLVHQSINKKTN